MATGMSGQELWRCMQSWAEKVNQISASPLRLGFDAGFAILIPEGTSEDAIRFAEKELIAVKWSLERITIRGRQYFVLFPFG